MSDYSLKSRASKLRMSGMGIKEIASTVGKSKNWVSIHTKSAAESRRVGLMIKAFKLSKSGMSNSSISKHRRVSKGSVSKFLSDFASQSIELPSVSDPSQPRISEMRDVKLMIDTGIHPLEIAEICDVSRELIRDVTYIRASMRSGSSIESLCSYKDGVWHPEPQFVHDWTFDIDVSDSDELSDYYERQGVSNQLLLMGVSVEEVSRRLGISRAEVVEMQEV